MNNSMKTRLLSVFLSAVMAVGVMSVSMLASETDTGAAVTTSSTPLYDTAVSNDYFKVISADTYTLAPGAVEHEIVLNNGDGNDRKVVHVFEVNTKEETLEVMPGYWVIDKLDSDNLSLEGIADKAQYCKAEQLTKTVAYYEGMDYNVVGAMNTAFRLPFVFPLFYHTFGSLATALLVYQFKRL